ncbi:MAG TPA: EB domain-containing protein [Solirubrobacteraceae bacterium]|nr:EB domain-containing protein [Solirubrobacteraceae bacterium]
MVNKRLIGSMIAAFSLVLAFPALASAHILSVSVGPSQCAPSGNGEYTATFTITETAFGGTTEDIPVGQNVKEVLASSSDKGNTGFNQNYFTTGAVGTQTGQANLGQPTLFSSPSNSSAQLTFTITTSVPETYVLGNSYMRTPSSATATAPKSGCTPTCPTGDTLVNGKCVPPTSCPAGETLTGGVCVPPTSCPNGQTLVNGQCVPPTSCPNGQVLSGGQCVPPTNCPGDQVLSGGKCVPPTTCPSGQVLSGGQCVPPTSCPSGQVLAGGQCVPPTACPAGETLTGNVCATTTFAPPPKTFPGVCRASTMGYKVRAGQIDTIVVAVTRHGAAVSGAKVKITLPGGKTVSRSTAKNGKVTFTVEPTRSGTIVVRSPSCKEMVKVKVFAAKAATAVRSPSFTG